MEELDNYTFLEYSDHVDKWGRCDQMKELDNYTFLEYSDHVDKGKKLFFINFGATSFLRQFSKRSEICYIA